MFDIVLGTWQAIGTVQKGRNTGCSHIDIVWSIFQFQNNAAIMELSASINALKNQTSERKIELKIQDSRKQVYFNNGLEHTIEYYIHKSKLVPFLSFSHPSFSFLFLFCVEALPKMFSLYISIFFTKETVKTCINF